MTTDHAVVKHDGKRYTFFGHSVDDATYQRLRRSHQFDNLPVLEAVRAEQLKGSYLVVGAGLGVSAVFYARACGCEHLMVAEPVMSTHQIMVRNLIQNDAADNALLFDVAVNSGKPKDTMTVPADDPLAARLDAHGTYKVLGRTLDELAAGATRPLVVVHFEIPAADLLLCGCAALAKKPLLVTVCPTAQDVTDTANVLDEFHYEPSEPYPGGYHIWRAAE